MKKYRMRFTGAGLILFVILCLMMLIALVVNLTLFFSTSLPLGQNVAISVVFICFFALMLGLLLFGLFGSCYRAEKTGVFVRVSVIFFRIRYEEIRSVCSVLTKEGKTVVILVKKNDKIHVVQLGEEDAKVFVGDILREAPFLPLEMCSEQEDKQ